MKKLSDTKDLRKFFFEIGLVEEKTETFKVIDIDLPIEEVLLGDSFGNRGSSQNPQ